MIQDKRNTPGKLILFCVFFALIVLLNGFVVVGSPYIFVKIINLFVVIVLSGVIGAFIREIFILKQEH